MPPSDLERIFGALEKSGGRYLVVGGVAVFCTVTCASRRISISPSRSTDQINGDPFSLTNRFRGGDIVQGAIGVLGFDFSLYRIFPTGAASYTALNPRPELPDPVGGTIRVAAMNTLNFFVTADYPTGNPLDNACGPLNNVECRGWDSDQVFEFNRQRDNSLQHSPVWTLISSA